MLGNIGAQRGEIHAPIRWLHDGNTAVRSYDGGGRQGIYIDAGMERRKGLLNSFRPLTFSRAAAEVWNGKALFT